MKTKNLIILGVLILVNIFAQKAIANEFTTIADLRNMESNSNLVFTGELTLQYVSENGNNYYAFDANNNFVRLVNYSSWSDLVTKLKKGDKIIITEELTFKNDDDNCISFELSTNAVKSIACVGQGIEQKPQKVTINDLNTDVDRRYNAEFVLLQGVKVESIVDFNVSPFPITKIVDGNESIDFSMEMVETSFPSLADIYGFVNYEGGKPKLFVPNINEYVKPTSFDNIAGLKQLTNRLGYNDMTFVSTVLVTYKKEIGNDYVYFIQKNAADGNPAAMQVVVSKLMNLDFQVGDSVYFDIKGRYEPAYYESKENALAEMSSATFIVDSSNGTKVLSSHNSFESLSFDDILANNGWLAYDNCFAITIKGEVVIEDAYTSIGCIGLKLKNEVTNKYHTIPVVNTYYAEVGSPQTAIVCGFVCGYKSGDKSYAVLMPRSKNDFLNEVMAFNNIADLKAAGRTPSHAISYKLTGPLAITGFTSEKFEDAKATFYKIFVQDGTGAIQLNHQSAELQKRYKVGDVITNVVGYYMSGGHSVKNDNVAYFASAPAIDIQAGLIASSEEQYVAKPVEVSLANLNDSYASQLVTIKNITYEPSSFVVLNGDTLSKPMIYQKNSWAIVSDKFEYEAEMGSVTGVYYLYGVMTQILPRTQSDIVVEGYDPNYVSLENIQADSNLFISDNTIYADGAMIEVYDIMGRLVVKGLNMIHLANNNHIVIVKTIYNNSQFVTKLVNR